MWAWCERARELALSVFAVPELISAFRRLQREGRLTATQYQNIKGDLLADITDAIVCDTTPQVIQYAVQALEAHPLRGMDAIHLGAARVEEYTQLQRDRFFGSRLIQHAVARNLQVLAESSQRLSQEAKSVEAKNTPGGRSLVSAISSYTIILASIWRRSGLWWRLSCRPSGPLSSACANKALKAPVSRRRVSIEQNGCYGASLRA